MTGDAAVGDASTTRVIQLAYQNGIQEARIGMLIPNDQIETVRALNIDQQNIAINYTIWETRFPSNTDIGSSILVIKEALGTSVIRSALVNFYQRNDIKTETKFIAAMMWGYGAPPGGRSDSRGPWRVSKMFSRFTDAQDAIRAVVLNTCADIARSYQKLNNTLERCGPNFFTKHFYFLGKAQGLDPYPLIYDNRVANGLIRIALSDEQRLRMVLVSAARTPKAYLQYLTLVRQEAKRIHCYPDQIELYLFGL